LILQEEFNKNNFQVFIKEFLPNFEEDERIVENNDENFDEVIRLGFDKKLELSVLVIKTNKAIQNRITVANSSFRLLKKYQIYKALVAYVNENEPLWRLSLLTALPRRSDTGKVEIKFSNPKRHSYVLGENIGVATPRKYLVSKGSVENFEDLQQRFSIETVNKDFYKEIADHFYNLVGTYDEENKLDRSPILSLPSSNIKLEDLQNYAVRMLGRILFIWFLKQKKSSDSSPLLSTEAVEIDNSQSFLQTKLEPLFFEVLNKPHKDRESKYNEGHYQKIPFLNGGLFHPSKGSSGDYYDQNNKELRVHIPNDWFLDLFKTLNMYNFTIDENLENDVDLSIDPEMLGRIFENLLAEINPETGIAARKSTGSYYTPRRIVNYMVDEGLHEYLIEKTEISSNKIKALISLDRLDDLEFPLSPTERIKVIKAISKLKFLDPSCGSGAFPMGLLQKLLWMISQLDPTGENYLDSEDYQGSELWLTDSNLDYLRKRKLIRDVIYGLDIQPVAVEITKLRCFLTLIVDQEINDKLKNRGIVPLPNLDFKFICADSLTPLEITKQGTFADESDTEKKLQSIRRRYFAENNESKKEKLKSDYIGLISKSSFFDSERISQLKSFNPFIENNQSKFFDSQTMFGFSEFDLILGNPPYVSVKAISNEDKEKYKKIFETGKGRFNLFTLFLERGHKLLKKDGNLVYIIPDVIFSNPEYRHIRQYIVDNGGVIQASLFSEKVFDAAVDTAILQISKNKNNNQVIVYEDLDQIRGLFKQRDLKKYDNFIFPFMINRDESDLINKIELNSMHLVEKHFIVQQGIIYSGQSKEKVFANTQKSSEYKPSLDGRDVLPFKINWLKKEENLYIKYTNKLHRPRDERLFLAPMKIVMPRKSTKLVASVDTESFYTLNTAYVLVPQDDEIDIYFLCGLLNSKLLSYYYSKIYFGWQVTIPALKKLPINMSNLDLVNTISQLSMEAHRKENTDKDIQILNEKIDNYVFELYSLNDAEILKLK
tara:strand:+ start:3841 stop:6837 length:2997 start_codon:yes stop_codon:yes gene_type:complete